MDSNSKTELTINKEDLTSVITRTFENTTKEAVFNAYTQADKISQWWGVGGSTRVDELDLKVGGKWRYVDAGENGEEYAFRGEFKEVSPFDKLSYTFEFEGMPGRILVETITLTEEGDNVKVVNVSKYNALEDLEGLIASGMEWGAKKSMEQLAKLVENIK